MRMRGVGEVCSRAGDCGDGTEGQVEENRGEKSCGTDGGSCVHHELQLRLGLKGTGREREWILDVVSLVGGVEEMMVALLYSSAMRREKRRGVNVLQL